MKKKILALTGIRSEYDILYPILKEFEKQDFEIAVAVSGAHLSDIHGNTYEKISKDGFRIADKIDCLLNTDRPTQRTKGIGFLITGLAQTLEREKPDFLLVVGDREESIACSIVGNYMDTLVIHVGGGDPAYGHTDDPIRFACSKLSHIHCATSEMHAKNLEKIGEDSWRITHSGNPSYVNIFNTPHKTRKELSDFLQFDIESSDYIVLIKHPLNPEISESYHQMKVAIHACGKFAKQHQLKVIGIYPNTDPGSHQIIQAIHKEQENYPHMRFYKTLPREIFINLIRHTLALAGNSSMGILEAPFYKLPVVNIGNRQQGRFNAGNVRFTKHDEEEIIQALKQACFDLDHRMRIKNLINPYGDETSCQKIVNFVKDIDPKDPKWLIKTKLC